MTVPTGVTTVHFQVNGAIGGGTHSKVGYGGTVSGTLVVTSLPNRTLTVIAGANGQGPHGGTSNPTGGAGGAPGGGAGANGHNGGGGGGGWTGVTVGSTALAIAGAGGGTGGYGSTASPNDGGSGGATGASGSGTDGGGGATQSGGGGAGGGGGSLPGSAGGSGGFEGGGGGGGGGGAFSSGGGGGGAGAGWYGGGGGGGGGTDHSGGGGGGGSSNVHGTGWVTNATYSGTSTGYAYVSLSWTLQSTTTSLAVTGTTTPQAGQTVTLKATVKVATVGVGQGVVTFKTSGGTTVTGCATRPVRTGIATCTLKAPGTATNTTLAHSYTAQYKANLAYATSTSGTATFTTEPDAITIGQVSVTTATPVAPTLDATLTPPSYATTPLSTAGVTFYWAPSATTPTATRTEACANTVTATAGKAVTASCRFTTAVPGTTYSFTATFAGQGENAAAGPSVATTSHLTKTSPTVTLSSSSVTTPVFGQAVTVHVSVTGLPKKDTTPGYVSFETTGGTPLDCTGATQKNPLPGSNTSGTFGGTCTFDPGGTGNLATEKVVAAYSGDAQTDPVTSTAVTFSVTPGTATITLTITPPSTPVGAPVALRAVVTDPHYPMAPIAGEVLFKEGTTVLCTVTAVETATAKDGVATCSSATAPTSITILHFSAVYCPGGSTGNCADWSTTNTALASDTTGPDPTQVVLTPSATQTNPDTLAGGQSVSVTATVSTTAGSQGIGGTLTFEQNGSRINATGGGTCSTITVPATGKVTCTFVPVLDNEDTVVATFTAGTSLLAGSTSARWYVKVSGQATTTAVTVAGPVDYGVPASATATVSVVTGGSPVPSGTVAFSVDGTPVASCAAQPVSFSGTASCALPPSALAVGTRVVAASFAYAGGTYGKSAGTAPLTVDAAPTSTVLAIGPTAPTTDLLTVTVTNTATGAVLPPTGTVTVSATATAVCTKVALAPSSGPAAVATCAVPRPTAKTPYVANYTPSDADFTAGTPFTLTFTATRTCGSGTFATVWALAGRTLQLSVDGASTVGSIGLTVGAVSGTCLATGTIPFSGASLDLFGTTVASTAVSGYLQGQATGPTLVCLTGGTLGLPSGWSIGALKLSATERLCFSLKSVTGTSATGTLGPPSGSLTVSGASLPFGFPTTSASYQLTLDFRATPVTLTVHVAPVAPPASSPWATVTVTVKKSASGFTATGALEVENLPFLGTPIGAAFTVSTGTSGSISGAVTLTIPATATYSPVPGLTLRTLHLALSSATGLAFGATAVLGPRGTTADQVTVTLSGGYHAHRWTLTLAATKIPSWTPVTGLTLNLTLSGQLVITTAGSSTVVNYDFQAGTAPSGHTGTALATWSPGGGVTVTVDCVAFAFGLTPACGAGPTASSPTDPTLLAQGSVAFGATGGGSGITAGFMGSFDLKTHGVDLSYDATAGPVSVTPVSGLTLTLTTLHVSGRGTTLSVTGKATAVASVLGAGSFTVSFSDTGGTLVIAGLASFAGTHVPLTGLLVYASKAVATFTTGISTIGKVALTKGFTGFALYHPTAAVLGVLRQVDAGLGTGAAVVFQAHWAPGGSPSFSLTLGAGKGFPFLSLPDTGAVTSATLSYASTTLSLSVVGTIPVPGTTPAAIQLTVTVGTGSSAGTFSGTATVSTLVVFGQKVGLSGSISRATTGKITATVSTCEPKTGTCVKGPIPGPITPFPGVPLQLSTVSFSLGTSGISVAATMSVDTLGSLAVTGSLQKLQTWSLTVTASAAQSWSPVPGVTFSPSFTGTVADAAGTVTFSLVASGASGSPLFTLSPGPTTLAVGSVGLGDAPPPTGCTVEKTGDLWLTVNGSLTLSLASANGSVTAAGCFDLTAKSFSLTATVSNLSFSALTGHVVLGAPTVTISGSSGSYQVAADATLTVTMPTGGKLVTHATLEFESGGGFVIGAEVNLSQWLGSAGDFAYLYYSSKKVTGFDTGDPTLKKIDLAQGITFALAITLPTTVAKGLHDIGITLPAGSSLKAVGTATFSSDTYQLTISVSLGTGIQLFTAGGAKLLLDSGFLQLTLAPSQVTFGLGLTATLDLPSPGAMGKPSHVALAGELSISDTGINVSLSLGHCGSTTGAWNTAFGAPGLTVQCASLTGGITYEFPFVDVGLSGTITGLPSSIANVTGYQQGAPISFAFNLDPFLLKLSIGTKNSTTPALEPLSFVGQGTLIKVYYAELYISPQGATIGSTVYPAGISMGFQATLFSVKTSILASIGLSPPSITFTATISKITLSGLSIGPVSVVLAASPSKFEFRFTGTATLGPGSSNIGPDLKVGGELSASVQIDLSTSKLSAFISGSAALTVATWVAQTTCWTGPIPYGCNYHWSTTGFSVTLAKTGFSITGTGVTLEADGYTVTFDYNGHVSASLASTERPIGRHRPDAHVARSSRHDPAGLAMALAATRHPITATPTTAPVPPPSGPRLTGGKAVLVPASPSSSTPPSTGGSGAPGSGGVRATPTPTPGSPVGSWQKTAAMGSARAFPATAALHNGDVLVAGGAGPQRQPLSSAEVYDPATGKWSPVGAMSTARVGATATVLRNGDVLVAGGYGATKHPLDTAELFDPATGRFTPTGSMRGARGFASSEPLPDGGVLVLGGVGAGHTPLKTAERYDPRSGTFASAGSTRTAHAFGAVARLANGQVLVAGGRDATGPVATAERYDPTSGKWSPAGTMTEPRAMASAATLPNGDVLVVGDAADGDLYDPSTGTWTPTQGMPDVPTLPVVAALPGGQVLVAGGRVAGSTVATAVLYQPVTRSWQNAGSMPAPTTGAATAVLSNGQVLVAGGAEITANPGGSPTITTEATASLYSPPAGTGSQPSTLAIGAPLAVVSSSPLPIALGSAGGVVVLAALGFWIYESRRRRGRRAPAGAAEE